MRSCVRGQNSSALRGPLAEQPITEVTYVPSRQNLAPLCRSPRLLHFLEKFTSVMEFDSLAFSATRLAPAKEDRVYCPACQDVCEPEPSTGSSSGGGGGRRPPPTCPVCSEECVVRPPAASEVRAVAPPVHSAYRGRHVRERRVLAVLQGCCRLGL